MRIALWIAAAALTAGSWAHADGLNDTGTIHGTGHQSGTVACIEQAAGGQKSCIDAAIDHRTTTLDLVRSARSPDETPSCYSGGVRKVHINRDCKELIAGHRQLASAEPPGTGTRVPQRATASSCNDCGVVTKVQAVEQEGEGGWTGKIGGAVVGGLLGNQIGGGTGKTIATVAGAAGGAYAGNEVQKHVSKKTVYQVSFKLNSGAMQTVKFDDADHGFHKGDKIRFENGLLSHR
ncbi:glycine zipper 2TM domain-containing protein [Jeongeupia chitinilytica]|uniref:Glycine zipper 2TM domain-containing protein n=1 Tax=Jeongeupia chitinilytica TaxID=1041641 RepID=A0ABQ3GVA7_9NEIS|nr:glycine zipper 2TM domain-containing protein [Jeongeupia chitinilytica]GHD56690.1 hypothetical protein GCM10007350_04270 [Jeongeupia chitinilytica]